MDQSGDDCESDEANVFDTAGESVTVEHRVENEEIGVNWSDEEEHNDSSDYASSASDSDYIDEDLDF